MTSHELVRAAFLASAILIATSVAAQKPPAAPPGAAAYQNTCAVCHDAGVPRAPTRAAFAAMAPEQILLALENGSMITMAITLSSDDRRAVAEYLSGKPLTTRIEMNPSPAAMCTERNARVDFGSPTWTGWGVTPGNARFQSDAGAGLTAAQLPRLAVRWAFGLPGDNRAYGAPTIAGGRVYFGSQAGKVYSLDARTGCVHWYFDAGAGVRAAIALTEIGTGAAARRVAIVADQRAIVRALDAAAGTSSGRPASTTSRARASPDRRRSIEAGSMCPSRRTRRRRAPSLLTSAAGSAAAWSLSTSRPASRCGRPTPSASRSRRRRTRPALSSTGRRACRSGRARRSIRSATRSTRPPATTTPIRPSERSDAFVAFDLDTGKVLWARQTTAKDAYVAACRMVDKTNCADSNGPDYDFGASPILADLGGGKRALLAGQKSGVVYALDPDRGGEMLWQQRVGQGGSMGGVQWGSAADGGNVYVAVSDVQRIPVPNASATDADPKQGGGMFALRLRDGERVWHTPPAELRRAPALQPGATGRGQRHPGAVFSGSMDGHLRAYSTADGTVLWDFDTVRSYETVNGVPGRGGSLDGAGPAIAGGL